MDKVCIWPDGTWCYLDEVEGYLQWMSDDYAVVMVPESIEDIDEFIGRVA